jgi:hypothetical protein
MTREPRVKLSVSERRRLPPTWRRAWAEARGLNCQAEWVGQVRRSASRRRGRAQEERVRDSLDLMAIRRGSATFGASPSIVHILSSSQV